MLECKICGGECQEKNGRQICKNCGNDMTDYVPKRPAYATNRPSGARSSNNELSGEEVYEKAIASVVEIYVENRNSAARASGFIVSTKGFILTNAHAVLTNRNTLYDNIYVKIQGEYYEANVFALGRPHDATSNENTVDLCLLFVANMPKNVHAMDLGSVEDLKNGQKVFLIGNSLGYGTCITSGIISDKEREMRGLSYPYIMTDAAANPGNSGGPLLNLKAETIGVLVAGVEGAKGMNYAIPVDIAKLFLQTVLQKSEINPALLGELSSYAYKSNITNHSMTLGMALSGVKLLADVIAYIVELFRKR